MARETLNPESLTFEEWVCAAGVAVFDRHANDLVQPYTESHISWRSIALTRHNPGLLKEETLPEQLPRHLRVPCRNTTVHYPKKVRAAWRAGEDPTDWRAANG